MRCRNALWAAVVLSLGLWLGAATPSQATPLTYHVDVNTTGLSWQGNLDFQFNPGGSSAAAATATVSNFQTSGGGLTPSITLTGNATGLLPGTLTLGNSTAYNDAFQGFTFGNSFSFDLTLSGAAVGQPGGTFGSSFAVSLYDAAGVTPLLTTDPNGSVLAITLNANGTTSLESFAQSPTDSTPAAGASLVSATPEPSSLVLLAAMLPAGLMAFHCGRRRAKQENGPAREKEPCPVASPLFTPPPCHARPWHPFAPGAPEGPPGAGGVEGSRPRRQRPRDAAPGHPVARNTREDGVTPSDVFVGEAKGLGVEKPGSIPALPPQCLLPSLACLFPRR
jgi:hypothetical protein